MYSGKRIWRVLKKILKGEDVLTVHQDQEAWDRQFREGKWNFLLDTPMNIATVACLCQQFARDRVLAVLDVGCGNGALPAAFVDDRNIRYCGTDLSDVALETAKKNYPKGEFIREDRAHPPVFEKKFDVIVFCEVLLYLDFMNMLRYYEQYLAEGGVVIISLYDSWRTRLIWLRIRNMFRYQYFFR